MSIAHIYMFELSFNILFWSNTLPMDLMFLEVRISKMFTTAQERLQGGKKSRFVWDNMTHVTTMLRGTLDVNVVPI